MSQQTANKEGREREEREKESNPSIHWFLYYALEVE